MMRLAWVVSACVGLTACVTQPANGDSEDTGGPAAECIFEWEPVNSDECLPSGEAVEAPIDASGASTLASAGMRAFSPTSAISPSRMTTVPFAMVLPFPVTIFASFIA